MLNLKGIGGRFLEKRFGMFIHWGIYAAGGWHEQQQYRQAMTRKDYLPLMKSFDPTQFNPDAWLDQAQACGMEYLVFYHQTH